MNITHHHLHLVGLHPLSDGVQPLLFHYVSSTLIGESKIKQRHMPGSALPSPAIHISSYLGVLEVTCSWL